MKWPRSIWLSAVLLGLSAWALSSPAGFAGEPTPSDWRSIAYAACARHGCDSKLLIAIGLWEPDRRENESIGDDGASFGRWQMRVTTAGRHVLVPPRTSLRQIKATEFAAIVLMLSNDALAADIAARELERCRWTAYRQLPNGNWKSYRRASPWGTVHILQCWNPRADYAGNVLAKYREVGK